MKNLKFSHKTPHLVKKQHQLDPNLDLKQLVHHATVQYVDRDADGDVDIYDNPKKGIPDENVSSTTKAQEYSNKLIKKQKGEIKHSKQKIAFEDLRNWFDKDHPEGNWKRYNTKGEAIGPCAREPGESKPKCLSNEKAAKMSKDEIAASVKRKREADPVADRKGKGGKPIMSSNNIEEGLVGDLVDKIKGRKQIGTTGSGGKVYVPTRSKKSTVKYGGDKPNAVKPKPLTRSQAVKSAADDPWSKGAISRDDVMRARQDMKAARTEEHEHDMNGEEERYCPLCDKRETRSECAYGEKAWDKVSVKDEEYSMARSELETISKAVSRLKNKVNNGEGDLEAWVQSKITKAADYIDTAADYLESGESKIEEACWDGYKQVGMKKKGKKMVPNCVPESVMPPAIDSKEHRKQQRSAKIRNLAQQGSTEGERKAAENKTKGPKLFGENLSLVDKILLEMEAEVLNEKNAPTNPSLWSKMKAKAKAKFDVYPSAYANGWAAKEYKKAGGGWKSVDENVVINDANGNPYVEFVDLIKPDSLVSEAKRECDCKCGQSPCITCGEDHHKEPTGGSSAKPGPNKNYVKPMGEQIEEAVSLKSARGNLLLVYVSWKGTFYSLKIFFPSSKMPNRREVQDQIDKIYPGGKVTYFKADTILPGEQILQAFAESIDKDKMKCNKPKAQAVGDSLTGKSHVVKACEGGEEKIIRFGQRGVKGSPKKKGESNEYASRRRRFQTRHAKNIAKGKMSAAYWANKVKW
jgi:hypothetical protein